MEQRDLIKDQLEIFGKALSKVLGNFLGLKNAPNSDLTFEQTNQQLKTELDIDVDLILGFSQQQLTSYLLEKKIPPPHLETLIEYFVEMGEYTIQQDAVKGKTMLKKALEMYMVLDSTTSSYSFGRREKEQKIQHLLQHQ